MPGLVALRRRWSLGSDDLVLPGCTLFIMNLAWLIALAFVLGLYHPQNEVCSSSLRNYIIGYMVIVSSCLLLEGLIVFVSLRGTIFYTRPRTSMEYLLYGRSVLLILCLLWTFIGIVWLAQWFSKCPVLAIKNSVLGIVVYNLILSILIIARTWCLFDSAGRSFVQLKQTEKQCAIRRSASRVERNRERQIKTQALYEQNWEKRFHRYCCCIQAQEPQENAFSEIALLFSDFFRDLDIVPSDIVAGLMLLREEQKQSRRSTEQNPNNDVLKFLSGVPITPNTKFADFSNHDECQEFEELIYYYKYAAAAYGWPVYAMFHPLKGCCQLLGRCACCRPTSTFDYLDLADDNCCRCNFTALKKLSGLEDGDIVYATFHSAVSTNLRDNPHNLSTEFGLDTEGLDLVGTPKRAKKTSGDRSKGATLTSESGICLETSLSFQEEMDERCLRGGKGGAQKGGGCGKTNKRRQSLPSPSCMKCSCLPRFLNCSPSRTSSVSDSAENVNTKSTVWETPFFVALDHSRRRVIVSVRGTLSMQDWLTDLNADISAIPLENCPANWFGHKGMVEAAAHIRKKLQEDMILSRAFTHDPEKGTQNYDLVLVGHSLGAGTVSILSVLLKPDYPKLQCYAYSPPGGLLSMPAVDHTKDFVTSLVVGKDIVTRVGLAQMEYLRADLLDCIKRSTDPKWRIIFDGLMCCREINPKNLTPRDSTDASPSPPRMTKAFHPTNPSLLLSTHNPLYPPGKILQIVRTNPKREGLDKRDCAWFGVWRDSEAFDEVLISPVMIGDHLPKNVMSALHKCLQYGRLHGLPRFSRKRDNRPSNLQYNARPKMIGETSTPSTQSSPSSCLVLNAGNSDNGNPDRNSNHVRQSGNKAKTSPRKPKRESRSKAGQINKGMQTSGSLSPVYASYESLPKCGYPDGEAPLARFDTMSEIGSLSSYQSSTTDESKLPQQRMHDAYCYYVNEDLKSPSKLHTRTNSFESSQIVTMACVEPAPDRTGLNRIKLHREESTKVMDRYGNVKSRTSTNDRYRLTYDSGSQSSVNKNPAFRPGHLDFKNSNSSSQTSSGNMSSDQSPSLPEALLGQAYTCYRSLSLDTSGSSPDFEDDFPSLAPCDGTFQNGQGGNISTEMTELLRIGNRDSVEGAVTSSGGKRDSKGKPSERIQSLIDRYGETQC